LEGGRITANEKMSNKVTIYSTHTCPYCIRAKQLLEMKGIPFTEIMVDSDSSARAAMEQKSGRRTVPQIFIGERHVGGYDDLRALDERGELDDWLR
jgi:glutaredoxin 3